MWDSRVYWGNDGSPVSTNEVNALELVQAYAAASIPLGNKRSVSLQAGRFTLNLGSRRLVAADDYRNTTNGYTGLKADFVDGKGTSATLIYVLPQQRRPDNLDSLLANEVRPDHAGVDLVLWGGLAAREKLIGPLAVEAMFMRLTEYDHGDRQTRDRRLNNLSLRLLKKPRTGEMDLDVEAISQSGKIAASTAPAAPTLDVQAWFLHGSLGYSFPGPGKVRVSAEYDQASGDGPGGGYGRFDTLFGMRRGELGPAGLYNAFGRANVISPGLRVEAAPFARTEGFLTLRPLWLDSPTDSFSTTGVRDARGQSGRYAGTQFDMRVRQRVGKALQLELNVVLLGKGRFLLEAPSRRPARRNPAASPAISR